MGVWSAGKARVFPAWRVFRGRGAAGLILAIAPRPGAGVWTGVGERIARLLAREAAWVCGVRAKARFFPASMRFPGTGLVSGMAEKFFRDAGVGSLAYKAIVLRGKPLWEYGRIPRGGSGDLCGKKDSAGLAGGARFAGAPAGNMRTARHDRMEKTSPFPGSGAFFGNGVGFWHGDEDFSGALAMPGFDCSACAYVGGFGGQARFWGRWR